LLALAGVLEQQRCAKPPRPWSQGRIKVVWGPWLKLRKGPFCTHKTVVNGEKINERTDVFVLLKQKKLKQKKTNR